MSRRRPRPTRSCRSLQPTSASALRACAALSRSAARARAAYRPVGSVRRVDRIRMDALDSRAVRVSVHAGLSRRGSTPAICSMRGTTCLILSTARFRGSAGGTGRARSRTRSGHRPERCPAEYRSQLGRVTADKTIPQLRRSSRPAAPIDRDRRFGKNLAAAPETPGRKSPRRERRSRCRAEVLRARIGSHRQSRRDRIPSPPACGERTDFFFDNSPVFKLGPGAAAAGVRTIALFDSPTPLHSGWAWGQKYLDGGVLAIDAPVGKGRVLLFGPGDPATRAAARHVQAAVQRHHGERAIN